jgi:hypothetical protein
MSLKVRKVKPENGVAVETEKEATITVRATKPWRALMARAPVGRLTILMVFSIMITPRIFSSFAKDYQSKSSTEEGQVFELTPLQELQVQNYKEGSALMLNFHITHHGGTTACYWARENGPVPKFACMAGANVPSYLSNFSDVGELPWSSNQTDFYVRELRKYFHFVSWEFNWQTLGSSLNDTNLEHPNLVSIIIMRNPLTRLMSSVGRFFVKSDTAEEWWDYASNSLHTNNYALRSLTSYEGCCQGEKTSSKYVDMAKSNLKRFTFIIDLECLEESLMSLCEILDLNLPVNAYENTHSKSKTGHYDLRSRLHNDTLYRHLVNRNARDIELYEWAKTQALVQCRDSAPVIDQEGLTIDT